MKNITAFFLAFFFLAFFNSAQGQQGSQNPVGGLSYAPDSNYVIYSQFYKGRNGVAMWVPLDSILSEVILSQYAIAIGNSNNELSQDLSSFQYRNIPNSRQLRTNGKIDVNTTGEEQTTTSTEDFFIDIDPDFEGPDNSVLSLIRLRNRGNKGIGVRRLLLHSEDASGGDRSYQVFETGTKLNRGGAATTYQKFSPPEAWLDIGRSPSSPKAFIKTFTSSNSAISDYFHFLGPDSTVIKTNFSINQILGNLTFNSGVLNASSSGSATYRFNLFPYSSLPILLEQTSAGDTAYLQLRASLGRATLRATQDIYLEAANSVFVSTLEGSSTGIISARPTGELIRREEAFFNAYFISDTITVAASETEIISTFLDAISPSFTVSGDSLIYTGTDTAYFDLGYYTEVEILESITGTYLLELSCYKNGVKVFPSEAWQRVYFTATETEPIQSLTKRFTTQLITGDVLNIRQNGTTGISAALHNFSFTGQKLQ